MTQWRVTLPDGSEKVIKAEMASTGDAGKTMVFYTGGDIVAMLTTGPGVVVIREN